MGLIKQFARRLLSVFGYVAVDARWPQQIQEALTQVINAASALERELAETKSGVSRLQGESGQTLSHIVVMRQELIQMLRTIQSRASTSFEPEPEREAAIAQPPSAVALRVLSIPERLERMAAGLTKAEPSDALANTRMMFAQHYLDMADLVSRHWIIDGVLPRDPYPSDDFTFAHAKRVESFIPGADIELEQQRKGVPWRFLWSDPHCSIFLVLGNATAANHGEGRHICEHEVYSFDFMRLRCSQAADPLPGATGQGGSIWSRLGERLIESGLAQRVMFVPLAVAGSQITDWIPGAIRHRRTALALSRLRKELSTPMLPFSGVLWQPGDDSALSERAYRLHCHDVIADLRANGVFAPVFITIANESKPTAVSCRPDLGNAAAGIFKGPDLDSIRTETPRNRQIDVDHTAALWLDILSSTWPLLARPGVAPNDRC